jgi:hypothetical protein
LLTHRSNKFIQTLSFPSDLLNYQVGITVAFVKAYDLLSCEVLRVAESTFLDRTSELIRKDILALSLILEIQVGLCS